MLALKKFQEATEQEINAGTVNATDYTVVLSQEPHNETLDDLPSVYYAWAENINSQEPEELKDPNTNEIDEN
jgi:hypothetical protein